MNFIRNRSAQYSIEPLCLECFSTFLFLSWIRIANQTFWLKKGFQQLLESLICFLSSPYLPSTFITSNSNLIAWTLSNGVNSKVRTDTARITGSNPTVWPLTILTIWDLSNFVFCQIVCPLFEAELKKIPNCFFFWETLLLISKSFGKCFFKLNFAANFFYSKTWNDWFSDSSQSLGEPALLMEASY